MPLRNETPSGHIDGINTTFQTSFNYEPNSLIVFVAGLAHSRTNPDGWTEVDPVSGIFDLNIAPLSGDTLNVVYSQGVTSPPVQPIIPSTSKPAVGDVWKPRQLNTAWGDMEPLVTAQQVKSRFLFGIPLYSAMKDPVTNKRMLFTDPMIMDEVMGAVSEVELETHLDIMPRKYREKQPFDRCLYQSWGYFLTEHRPVYQLDRLTVTTSNGIDVFTVPLEWAETGHLVRGQINLIPMGVALSGTGDPNSNGVVGGQSAGGAAFLAILGNQPWIASFWQIEYSTGFVNGLLPRPVNDLISCCTAMRVLSLIASTYARVNSASLGIDGLSQSIGGPGGQLFATRMQELAVQRKLLVGKLKKMMGSGIISGSV